MANGLHIVRLSGLGTPEQLGELKDTPRYQYWTGDVPECDNTVAVNYLISLINLKLAELEFDKYCDEAATMNEADMYVVALEALRKVHSQNYDIVRCGQIIGAMWTAGLFVSKETDDETRANDLEQLISTFNENYSSDSEFIGGNDFCIWWKDKIVDYDYNGLTTEQKERWENFEKNNENKIGDATYKGKSVSYYISNAGIYFLYLFGIDKNKISTYSSIIQKRWRKEKELYDWCCGSLGCYANSPIYTEEQIKLKIETGITAYYKRKATVVINDLIKKGKKSIYYGISQNISGFEESGRIGAITTAVAFGASEIAMIICAAVMAVASILAAIISCVKDVCVAKYSKPADEDLGIAEDGDWGLDAEQEKQNSIIKAVLIGCGVIGAYYLLKKR